MSTPKITRLRKGDKANFSTLQSAWNDGRVALLSSVDLKTGEKVALICAMGQDDDGMICPVPFAVMVTENPFERYADPTQ